MAENKKSFILYCDQKGVWDKLSNEQAGKLIKHIIAYVNDENPTTDDFITELAFEPIKQQLKRDLKSWEKQYNQRVEAGKKSAEVRKRNSTTVDERSISSTVNGNVNGNVTHTKEDVTEVSQFLSSAYSKKYNRDAGIGQDIDYVSKELLKSMDKKTVMDQIRSHKMYIGLHDFKPPSKLETIQAALLETDWIKKLKDSQDKDKLQNGLNNEHARRATRISNGSDLPPANLGNLDN